MPLPFELLEAFAAEWGAPIEAVIAVAIDAGFDVETRT
jgi:hypothetical protein